MSVLIDTRTALNAALMGITGVNPDIVAWENKDFTPPSAGVWYQAYFMPNTFDSVGKAITDDRQDLGIYQVTVLVDSNSDTYDTPQLEAVNAILEAFASGNTLGHNSVSVEIMNSSATPGRVSGGYFARDISVNYRTIN